MNGHYNHLEPLVDESFWRFVHACLLANAGNQYEGRS